MWIFIFNSKLLINAHQGNFVVTTCCTVLWIYPKEISRVQDRYEFPNDITLWQKSIRVVAEPLERSRMWALSSECNRTRIEFRFDPVFAQLTRNLLRCLSPLFSSHPSSRCLCTRRCCPVVHKCSRSMPRVRVLKWARLWATCACRDPSLVSFQTPKFQNGAELSASIISQSIDLISITRVSTPLYANRIASNGVETRGGRRARRRPAGELYSLSFSFDPLMNLL